MNRAHGDTKRVHHFQREMAALRAEAAVFAGQHPEAASRLGMGSGAAPDPQVDLLLQSFAFMGARLRHQGALDAARLPNALVESLAPHLSAPLPSMVMAQAGAVRKKAALARGQGVAAQARGAEGRDIECRFRLAYATTLLPLAVTAIRRTGAHGRGHPPAAASVLSIRLQREEGAASEKLGFETLRFFLDSEQLPAAFALYEQLALHLVSMRGLPGADNATLRWLGFDEAEAMLLAQPATPPGYRLLQEYFAFPQKFMFFELGPFDLSTLAGGVNLELGLSIPFEGEQALPASTLRLNCMPLVNLFSRPIEPVAIDHFEYEYRLMADLEQHQHTEICALERLYSVRADGATRVIQPYFGLDEVHGKQAPDYFYLARRERSEATNVAGAELYVSFLDRQLDLTTLTDEVIGGSALCSNRRLPEQLCSGSALQFEGAGPKVLLATLGKASAHSMPPQVGQRPWALASHLALNRLSLASGPRALAALKHMLRLHAGSERALALRQIDGIEQITCRTVMRRHVQDDWRGFVRALHVELKLDRHSFVDASPVLFWRVLRHFFALYVSVNNLVETSFYTNDCRASDADLPLLTGNQCIL